MRILIADDHPMYLDAIKIQVQRAFPDCHVVKQGTLEDALEFLGGPETVDFILLDYSMPGMGFQEGIKRLSHICPGVPVVVMSGVAMPENVREAVSAGAKGFLPKTLKGGAFISALNVVMEGGTYLPVEYVSEMLSGGNGGTRHEPEEHNLTSRQIEVLACLIDGKSNKEIARALDIREVTVKFHLSQIYGRLQVSNRAQAAAFAVQHGLTSKT